MKRIIRLVQIVFPIIGALCGIQGIILFVITVSEYKKLSYLYYNYGVIAAELDNSVSDISFVIFFVVGILFIFLPILIKILDGLFKFGLEKLKSWEKTTVLLANTIGILLIIFNGVLVPANFPTEWSLLKENRSEYSKYEISLRLYIYYNVDETNPFSNDYVKSIFNRLPDGSPYAKYSSAMSLEEQKTLIKELDKWWRENKNYAVWDEKTNKFKMDEEAKAAGVWTEEYRKIHPRPKEEKK